MAKEVRKRSAPQRRAPVNSQVQNNNNNGIQGSPKKKYANMRNPLQGSSVGKKQIKKNTNSKTKSKEDVKFNVPDIEPNIGGKPQGDTQQGQIPKAQNFKSNGQNPQSQNTPKKANSKNLKVSKESKNSNKKESKKQEGMEKEANKKDSSLEEVKIKKIGVLSFGLIFGLINLFMGIIGILFVVLLTFLASMITFPEGWQVTFIQSFLEGTGNNIYYALIFPLLSGIIGFISGLIFALIYNLSAKITKGIELYA